MTTLPLTGCCVIVLTAQTTTPSPGARRQFVTCPIVRDTKTQPCWLAEHQGELYYLGQQSGIASDFYPPQLGHQCWSRARWVRGAFAAAFPCSR